MKIKTVTIIGGGSSGWMSAAALSKLCPHLEVTVVESKDIPTVRQGLGLSIVSTPKGVMSDANARSNNVGGEIICTVF